MGRHLTPSTRVASNCAQQGGPGGLGLTDDGLAVVAGNVVEDDPIIVEVVEDGQTELVSLPVVGLGAAGAPGAGPGHVVVLPAAGPADAAAPHVPPGPEVALVLPRYQVAEVRLLGGAVQADRPHPVLAAEAGALPVGEAGAAEPPAHQVVPPLELHKQT